MNSLVDASSELVSTLLGRTVLLILTGCSSGPKTGRHSTLEVLDLPLSPLVLGTAVAPGNWALNASIFSLIAVRLAVPYESVTARGNL